MSMIWLGEILRTWRCVRRSSDNCYHGNNAQREYRQNRHRTEDLQAPSVAPALLKPVGVFAESCHGGAPSHRVTSKVNNPLIDVAPPRDRRPSEPLSVGGKEISQATTKDVAGRYAQSRIHHARLITEFYEPPVWHAFMLDGHHPSGIAEEGDARCPSRFLERDVRARKDCDGSAPTGHGVVSGRRNARTRRSRNCEVRGTAPPIIFQR